jgi:hypothetical protein
MRPVPIGVHIGAGAILGVLAQYADSAARWASALTSHGGIWLAALVVVGVVAKTPRAAAEWAVTLFAGVIIGYYVARAFDYGYAPGPRLVIFWAAMALTAAPLAAVLANALHHTTQRAAIIGALLGGGLFAEAVLVTVRNPSDQRWSVVWFDATVGLALLAAVAIRTRRPLTVLGAAAGATALGSGALILLTSVYNLV